MTTVCSIIEINFEDKYSQNGFTVTLVILTWSTSERSLINLFPIVVLLLQPVCGLKRY